MGYSNIDNYQSIYTTTTSSGSIVRSTDQMQGTINVPGKTMVTGGGVLPTIPTKSAAWSSWGADDMAYSSLSGVLRGHMSWMNTAWLSQTS